MLLPELFKKINKIKKYLPKLLKQAITVYKIGLLLIFYTLVL